MHCEAICVCLYARVHTVLHCAATLKMRIRPSFCGFNTSFNGCSQSNMVSQCNNSIDVLVKKFLHSPNTIQVPKVRVMNSTKNTQHAKTRRSAPLRHPPPPSLPLPLPLPSPSHTLALNLALIGNLHTLAVNLALQGGAYALTCHRMSDRKYMLKDCVQKQWRQIVYTVQPDFLHSIWGICVCLGIMGQRVNSD